MLDIRFVRENPEVVKENIKKKFQDEKLVLVDEVLAFDKENFRLGRGKGFYDRFFASCGKYLYKIGTGYSFQLVEQVPHEAHDLKLDAIILSP